MKLSNDTLYLTEKERCWPKRIWLLYFKTLHYLSLYFISFYIWLCQQELLVIDVLINKKFN